MPPQSNPTPTNDLRGVHPPFLPICSRCVCVCVCACVCVCRRRRDYKWERCGGFSSLVGGGGLIHFSWLFSFQICSLTHSADRSLHFHLQASFADSAFGFGRLRQEVAAAQVRGHQAAKPVVAVLRIAVFRGERVPVCGGTNGRRAVLERFISPAMSFKQPAESFMSSFPSSASLNEAPGDNSPARLRLLFLLGFC